MNHPVIEVKDVWKAFGEQRVLSGVDLAINQGETFVLLGASGSGKTVLLKVIAGLIRPERGSVFLDGREISKLPDEALADVWKDVGIVFQNSALFDSYSVFENIALPLRERTRLSRSEIEARIEEVLDLVGLRGVEDELPGELSGGMKKRVAFARAIALKPPILLFDDPTAGLDPLMTLSVSDEILVAKEKLRSTIFAITYNLTTAFRVADRIGLLYDGRIIGTGTPEEFQRNPAPAIRQFLHTFLEQGAASAPLGSQGPAHAL